MSLSAAQQARHSALRLLCFALVCTLVLASVYALTNGIVQRNEAQLRQQLLAQTLPAASFDNALEQDSVVLQGRSAKLLGLPQGAKVYIARKQGRPVALVFESRAANGYAGRIDLLVGVMADGRIHSVRVVKHQETPGLGDYIDAAKSPWAEQFQGKTAQDHWQVRKDGGEFDAPAGATISARAVVAALGKVMQVFAAEQRLLERGTHE